MIPKSLIEQIKEGNVVLFLGSGALIGATHQKGNKVPIGKELAEILIDKFLDDDLKGSSLSMVSELAISDYDLYTVQKFIADYFEDFEPCDFHLKVPHFRWKAIVTTNYDLVIEKTYSKVQKKQQILVKFMRDERINDKLKSVNDLLFIKLHGCITEINNPQLPLILTTDQYVTHKKNRERLFERVVELARNHTLLFIGHSLEDSDIREVLLKLDTDLTNRMRSYIIAPNVKSAIERMLSTKKITALNYTFSGFIEELTNNINLDDLDKELDKRLELDLSNSILNKISLNDNKPSESLVNFIKNDIVIVEDNPKIELIHPKEFYKGTVYNISPMIQNLDVRRSIENGIATEIFLNSEKNEQNLFVILGHAGSGKTVLLNRVAYEGFKSFNKICLILNKEILLNAEPIIELYNLVKERIFLFVDNAYNNELEIAHLIERSKKESALVTIISAERLNIWNVECNRIKFYCTNSYILKYLTESEINSLLNLLEVHDSLGYLKNKTRDVQIKEFEEKAGRELLVALYESTQGKSFQEIVTDEYHSIPDELAKQMYITVCLLHSLGTFARAGLISRVHNITYAQFEEKFFRPLDSLIFSKREYYINDFIYETRHRLISEFVIDSIFSDENIRFDEFIRLLNNLDIDYDCDKEAFLYLTNAKKLLNHFRDPSKIRQIYTIASNKSYNDEKLLQQQAIFEMESNGGSLIIAEKLLNKADEITNHNNSLIRHSLAELILNKALHTANLLEKKKLIRDVEQICESIVKNKFVTAHPYHTLIKCKLHLLQIYLDNDDNYAFEKIVKETELLISKALQFFPDESHIIESNSNFNKIIQNEPKALQLLEDAFNANKKSTYLCRSLANIYESNGDLPKAIETVETTLNSNPGDRDLNFKMGHLLIRMNEIENLPNIIHYLKRSFTKKDNRYHAQFWYARALYINNDIDLALPIFKTLSYANLDPKIKSSVRGTIRNSNGDLEIYTGEIHSVFSNYGFIKRNQIADTIYFTLFDNEYTAFEEINRNSRVSFNLGFNYKGPVAINVKIIY
ncbi:hypothetical protein GON26_12505 [Flavobacterium sp. GA093]|uniref:Novel STAND NTPase 5 domain-containing protein n=1 Tax=Flavobacterium hydrocarbonoxydans TaxID=2683249 RepID=A0A6I4NVZ0_9FLAO|nr:SIR2 family protein [Flavobacterium hydrocarbonoxydans]MWB95184.1 hypothetical protein [Flavobacterium hydrocarbonoxydans]